MAWGWRLPFLASIVLVVVGIIVRRRLQDAPEFQRLKQERSLAKVPVADLFRTEPLKVVLASLAAIGPPAIGYSVIVYMLTYGTQVVGFPRPLLLTLILLSTLVWIATIVVSAVLADRYGAKPIYVIGTITAVVWPLPMFALVDTGNAGLAFIAFCVAAIVQGLIVGAQGRLFTEIFDVRVRYSGASITYQIGGMIGGAVTPIAATALFAAYGSSTAVALYLTGICLLSLIGILALRAAHPARSEALPAGTD